MESSCVRHTQIPATSKLFSDFLYNYERVKPFFPHYFADPDAFKDALVQIQYPDSRRSALISALRPLNPGSAALDKLAQPGTVAVVTGQQVGLFSGPAYTVFKAITAARLAHQLTESGIPAVPVFWLATEDHDLAEVDHAWVFNRDAAPTKIALAPMSNGVPVGTVVPREWPIADLEDALGDLPFAGDVIARIREAYRPGATLGAAFLALLRDLLRDLDLVFIDPLIPEVRQIAAPLLSDAVRNIPDLLAALRCRNAELEAAGYHAQVHIEDDSSLLFLINGKRNPLHLQQGAFATKERTYNASELAQLGPALSPNALLRPVMQDYLLPTIAYVGGPAEVAYMAQAQVLYEKLLGRIPVIFPRNSYTLLDARSSKLLTKYRLKVTDLLDTHEHVRNRMAARLIPAALRSEFENAARQIASSLESVDAVLNEFDPTLEAAAQKSRSKMLYQLERMQRKIANEVMRRDERASRDADYVLHLVYPHRHLQERFYSIIPFLAKAGLDVPKRLFDETQLACADHVVRSW